jgi:pimeloyl-ACP methyl ester carboxylesterase
MTFLKEISPEDDPDRNEGKRARNRSNSFLFLTHRAVRLICSTSHTDEERRAAYSRYVHESGRALFEIGFSFLDSRKAASIDEKKIDVPVLVLAGAEDRITPASVNRKIASKYRDFATYMELPHHAHWIFGEPGWETVAGTIHFWLNQGEAGTSCGPVAYR